MKSIGAVAVLLIGFLTLSQPTTARSADERLQQPGDRWIPGGSIFTMGIPDERSARASSDTLPQEVTGDSTGFPWSVGLSAELASPVLAEIAGRPRLYIHGDFSYAVDSEEPVVSTGDPGAPPSIPATATATTVETIENIGAAVRVEAKPLVLSGGVGAVFSFEAWERSFRVRPSLEWIYRRDSINSVLGGGETENPNSTACTPCRTLFVDAQTEKGYHSLGPGVELEVDAARAGDFLLAFYGSFRAYHILGDRKADLDTVGAWQRTDGLPTSRPDTVFRTRYEREPWHYRFGLGLRFLWSPE